ncbi:MAG: glycosyltransferase [Lachnospiraceae bacterium]|nr:glycosyltransferase [Lachnospiraceae bacterium]
MCEFSLITVCLNPGEKLRGTLESALRQTYGDFELLIKDGGSTDGSIEGVSDLLEDPRIRVINRKDKSIYDAMNQAVEEAKGKYVYFLNCGDKLYDETVLEKVAEAAKSSSSRYIFYGNVV